MSYPYSKYFTSTKYVTYIGIPAVVSKYIHLGLIKKMFLALQSLKKSDEHEL
jgi:hypothetical protein